MAKNNNLKKTVMPLQDGAIRTGNFNEVALGYSLDDAMLEAERCLQCKKPDCMEGCPVNVQIPQFIALLQQGDVLGAYECIKDKNSLPAICGRVCPQESQCEKFCIRGKKGEPVAIGNLERFVADYGMRHEYAVGKAPANGHKVAVVGAGPAGLTCASLLAKKGYEVTIFEALHEPGGVLTYGIPEFRLPKKIVQKEISFLKELGVRIITNFVVGLTLTIDDLFKEGYEAVFVGSGAGLPVFMNIEGENLNGVYSANEFLTRINLMKAYDGCHDTPLPVVKKVVVVGGGNVAMDSARCALRLGAESVHIVYRRSEAEMPARRDEVLHAQEEGIIFKFLSNPVRILGQDGYVKGIVCCEMELGEPDASGRRRPIPKPDRDFILPADCVIIAIGTSPNPLIRTTTPGLNSNKWGCIIADEDSGLTSKENVYAGGDAVTGAATVILAMGAGKNAARAIDEKLSGREKS